MHSAHLPGQQRRAAAGAGRRRGRCREGAAGGRRELRGDGGGGRRAGELRHPRGARPADPQRVRGARRRAGAAEGGATARGPQPRGPHGARGAGAAAGADAPRQPSHGSRRRAAGAHEPRALRLWRLQGGRLHLPRRGALRPARREAPRGGRELRHGRGRREHRRLRHGPQGQPLPRGPRPLRELHAGPGEPPRSRGAHRVQERHGHQAHRVHDVAAVLRAGHSDGDGAPLRARGPGLRGVRGRDRDADDQEPRGTAAAGGRPRDLRPLAPRGQRPPAAAPRHQRRGRELRLDRPRPGDGPGVAQRARRLEPRGVPRALRARGRLLEALHGARG
mmetsp:Transcript_42452/g.132410  ORF Transcript_42452/g.132410 Transcript_42452/m.132410 type:complete len:334 (+) Transcript_42452:791-1792(+)